jgi:hypothetical protein
MVRRKSGNPWGRRHRAVWKAPFLGVAHRATATGLGPDHSAAGNWAEEVREDCLSVALWA